MLKQWAPFEELAKAFAEGDVCLRVAGLVPAARALAIAELLHVHPRAALVVTRGSPMPTASIRIFGSSAPTSRSFRSRSRGCGAGATIAKPTPSARSSAAGCWPASR